eukprot:jgi/Botrbrau1/2396/Bobra.0395s0028.1
MPMLSLTRSISTISSGSGSHDHQEHQVVAMGIDPTDFADTELLLPAAEPVQLGLLHFPFLVMCACLLLVNASFSNLVPIFPQVAEERGLSPPEVGLVFSVVCHSQLFVVALSGPPPASEVSHFC